MNKVILIGRLTKTPEERITTTGKLMSIFTLACSSGKETDFINCVAFDKTAELINKYCNKGDKVATEGRWKTDSYKNKDGKTVPTNTAYIYNVEFLETKKQEDKKADIDNTEIPF